MKLLENKKLLLISGATLTTIVVLGITAYLLLNSKTNKQDTAFSVSPSTKTEGVENKIDSSKYSGDISSKLTLKTVKLTGNGTQGLDVDPETGYVYLGNNGSTISKCTPLDPFAPGKNTLSVVDPTTEKEIARVPAEGGPIGPLVDTQRDVVYLANSGGGTVTIHKAGTGEKLDSIKVGGLPHAFGLFENLLVVSNTFDQSQTYYTVIDVDKKQVVASHKSPHLPHPVAVDPEDKLAYMMGVQDGTLAVIDMTTGITRETVKLESAGGQMVLFKKAGKIFADYIKQGSTAAAYDLKTKQLLGSLNFEGASGPGTGLAIDEEAGLFFVVIADQNVLGVASTETVKPLAFFKVGGCPYGVKIDAKRGLGFVSNSADASLTIFDLKELRKILSKN